MPQQLRSRPKLRTGLLSEFALLWKSLRDATTNAGANLAGARMSYAGLACADAPGRHASVNVGACTSSRRPLVRSHEVHCAILAFPVARTAFIRLPAAPSRAR